MTRVVEQASVPPKNSSLPSPNIPGSQASQGTSGDNHVPVGTGILSTAALKHEEGKLGKGAQSVKPGKTGTKSKEEFGYIVTNQRYYQKMRAFVYVVLVLSKIQWSCGLCFHNTSLTIDLD